MRTAGVLLPIASLPSNQGIGDFGKQAYHFIDILAQCHFKIWQILPLNPLGFGNSPYQSCSVYAGEELYINIDYLADDGFIERRSIKTFRKLAKEIDYKAVRDFKTDYFRKAYGTFQKNYKKYEREYSQFSQSCPWLLTYATYMALKRKNNQQDWRHWKESYTEWIKLKNSDSFLGNEILYVMFLQWIFHKQWMRLKRYANRQGISILGDIPMYVGLDCAEVWENPHNFLLDERGIPTHVAGVPPDYFSKIGQRWGNPLYHWENMRKESYQFWVNRLRWNQQLFDILRIDHFRAFYSYWAIPVKCETAVTGEWRKGPAYSLLDEVYHQLPKLKLVVEDLGEYCEEVQKLKEYYDLHGMRVLQFAISPEELQKGTMKKVILYTGTHDNDTFLSFYKQLSTSKKSALRRFLYNCGYQERHICDLIIRYCLDAKADIVIFPLQDILKKKDGRINIPGTVGYPNWSWKLKSLKAFELRKDVIKEWMEYAKRTN